GLGPTRPALPRGRRPGRRGAPAAAGGAAFPSPPGRGAPAGARGPRGTPPAGSGRRVSRRLPRALGTAGAFGRGVGAGGSREPDPGEGTPCRLLRAVSTGGAGRQRRTGAPAGRARGRAPPGPRTAARSLRSLPARADRGRNRRTPGPSAAAPRSGSRARLEVAVFLVHVVADAFGHPPAFVPGQLPHG